MPTKTIDEPKTIDDLRADVAVAEASLEAAQRERARLEAELARLRAGQSEIASIALHGNEQDRARLVQYNEELHRREDDLRGAGFDVQRCESRVNSARDDLASALGAERADRMQEYRQSRTRNLAEAIDAIKAARVCIERAAEDDDLLTRLQQQAGIKGDDWEKTCREVDRAVVSYFSRRGLGRHHLPFSRAHISERIDD